MALRVHRCQCGRIFEDISGPQIQGGADAPTCPACGKQGAEEIIGGSGQYLQGYDYSDPTERAMALSNRRKIEGEAENFLSGLSDYHHPKGLPKEFAPQVPEHLRKRYY